MKMFEWQKTCYQLDAEPSGGGDPAPDPAPEPTPEPVADDPGAMPDDPVPEPDPEPAPPPDPDPEPAPAPAPESDPVARPSSFDKLFAPPEPAAQPPAVRRETPATYQETPPTPADPPPAPPKVEYPTEEQWDRDPAKAGEQFRQATAWDTHQRDEAHRREIAELRQTVQGVQGRTWEETAKQVQSAIKETDGSVNRMYDPAGVLNSDKEFRNNADLQESVKNIIDECVYKAIEKADQTGDIRALKHISSDPAKFAYRVLALAKADNQSTIPDPAIRPQASPAGPQAPAPTSSPNLTAQEKADIAAARADGVQISPKDVARVKKKMQESVW